MNKLWNKGICGILAVALILPSGVAFGDNSTLEVLVPQFTPPALSTEAPKVILGYNKGTELLKDATYTDMTNNTFLKEVTKMSAMGVIRKYNSNTFRPASSITGNEAIAMLVKARGREAAVQRRVTAASTGLGAAALQGLYNAEYAREALTLNIVPLAEQVDLEKIVNREKLAVWAARTINLQADNNDLTGVFSFYDATSVSPQYRSQIEAMIAEKLIYLGNDGNFKPKAGMSRGEFAKTLEHMSERLMTNLSTTSEFGLIIGKKATTETLAGVKLTKTIYTVKSVDGKLNQLVYQYNPKTKVTNDWVTYKNRKISSSKQLLIGDEISYLMKNNQVYYAEAINDDTLLSKMVETTENSDGVTFHFGKVGTVTNKSRYENGKNIDTKLVRLKDFDGNLYDLNIETNPQTGVRNDVVVFKNNSVGGTGLLKEGDNVEYYVKDNKTMLYMKVVPVVNKNVTGTVRNVGYDEAAKMNTLSIYDYDNKISEYPVAQHALILINGNNAQLKDLQRGIDVEVVLKNGYITNVNSETVPENGGAIGDFEKMRMGSIYNIYSDGVLVQLNSGTRERYTITSSTKVIKDGVVTTLKALKPGDQVKLYFSSIYTNSVSKLEIEAAERLIKQIYKGTISDVNTTAGTMTLKDPYVLRNANWTAIDNYMLEIPYTEKTGIYAGSQVVRPKDFSQYYKDMAAYVVVEANYDAETAVKVNIRSGSELIVKNDTIDTLDTTLGSMELNNKENYALNEGTIIVNDGRLISPSQMNRLDNVYVVGDYFYGDKTASVVQVINKAQSIFENLYIGTIYRVDYSTVIFENYAKMTNNAWGAVETATSRRFYYTADTSITNVTVSDYPVAIKPTEFFNKGYGESENLSTDGLGLKYERYYGVFVTDGSDVIYGINLRKKGLIKGQPLDDTTTDETTIPTSLNTILKGTTLTRGTVEAIDTKWTRLQLTNSNDWSTAMSNWTANQVDTYVKYENTLIIKNKKAISISDIKEGDQIYVLRNKETAMVIFVEGN